ncbi:hypothetical protein D9M70_413450 [compost metagenome]
MARNVTRVLHNGHHVLSRNDKYVSDLRESLGWESFSLFHSHRTTTSYESEEILRNVDENRLSTIKDAFAPDLVLLCVDDMVAAAEPMLSASKHVYADCPQLFVLSGGNASFALRDVEGIERGNAEIGRPETIRHLVRSAVLPMLDRNRSRTAQSAVLKTYKAMLHECGARGVPAPINRTVPMGKAISLSSTIGGIESIKDGDVIFGNTLWFKGWVDFSNADLKCLLVRVNETIHKVFPNAVRGDLTSRSGNHGIRGFEAHLPIREEGARLAIKINLLSKSGLEHDWRKLFVWANNSVPPRYLTPVVSGEARLLNNKNLASVDGRVNTEGYFVQVIRVLQFGNVVGIANISEKTDKSQFRIELSNQYRVGLPIYLWLQLEGKKFIFWRSVCEPQSNAVTKKEIQRLNAPEEGSVISNGVFDISLPNTEKIKAYLNGVHQAHIDSNPSLGKISIEIPSGVNRVTLELTGEDGRYIARNYWNHPDEPDARTGMAAITLPNGGYVHRSLALEKRSVKNILLIRKAAAPTDELYVLAPLRRLSERYHFHIRVVDTETDNLSDDERLRLLTPGSVVVVSRYIQMLGCGC